MRTSPDNQKYAEMLLSALENQKNAELKEIISGFIAVMQKSGLRHKVKPIFMECIIQMEKAEARASVQVETAHQISDRQKKKIMEVFSAKQVRSILNSGIAGGIKIKFRDLIIDNSIASSLRQLNKNLSGDTVNN